MSQQQVHRGGRTPGAAEGHHVHREPGDQVTMQQLNGRLAAYLQQVQSLQVANQTLEGLIQEELDRKCPRERSELDGRLRTAALLQEQICDLLAAQASLKLQLLNAELIVFNLNARCEEERERRLRLEEELSHLGLLAEELQVYRLPELRGRLEEQSREIMELEMQHQQDLEDLLDTMSGGVATAMQPTESVDLIQQLSHMRQRVEFWSNTQASMLNSSEVTFDPTARSSEVFQAELEERRRTAASLEDELEQQQNLFVALEASGLLQHQFFVQQLVVLQQRSDGLGADLVSVLQDSAQQAADGQILLDVKTRLEAEILDYMRLLDGLSAHGVSSLQRNAPPSSGTTGLSTIRRNTPGNDVVRVQGGNRTLIEVQVTSRGHIRTAGETRLAAPFSDTVTSVQSTSVRSKHPPDSSVTSFDTERQRTEVCPDGTLRDFTTNSLVEDRIYAGDQDSSIVSQDLDKAAVKDDKADDLQQIFPLVPDAQPAMGATVQAEPFTYEQTTTEDVPQVKTLSIKTETSNTLVLCTETERRLTEPSIQTPAQIESAHIHYTEDSVQVKGRDSVQVVPLRLETPVEAIGESGQVVVMESCLSGAEWKAEDNQGTVSDDLTLMDDKEEKVGDKEGPLPVLRLDPGSALSVVHRYEGQFSALQAKQEIFASKQGTPEDSSHSNKTETNIQTEVTKRIPGVEPEATQGPQLIVQLTTDDPSKETSAGVKTEKETVKQISCTEGSIQAKNQECAQVVPLILETPVEAIEDTGHVVELSEWKQDKVVISDDLTLMVDQEKKGAPVRRLDPNSALSDASISKQNSVIEDADVVSSIATEDGLEANETETNIQTEVTKGVPAEPEVKHVPPPVTDTTTADPSKETSAEVKTETEEVDCLTLETQAEATEEAGEVTASCVSGFQIPQSEDQDRVCDNLTLKEDNDIEIQDKNEDKEEVDTLLVLRLVQIAALSEESLFKQNTIPEVGDKGSSIAFASLHISEMDHNLENKTAQGTISSIPDRQPSKSPIIQATPETFAFKGSVTEDALHSNKTETHIQTEVTRSIPAAESEAAQEQPIDDLSQETSAEVKTETEPVVPTQISCSIQAKNQKCAQVVPLSLEIQAKDVEDAEEPGSCVNRALMSEEAQGLISDGFTLVDDKDIEQEKRDEAEKEGTFPACASINEVKEASSDIPNSKDKLESKTEQGILLLVPNTQPTQVKQAPHLQTPPTTTEPSAQRAEMESIEGKSQESWDTQTEAVGDVGEVVASSISGPDVCRVEEVHGDQDMEKEGDKDEVIRLSDASNREQKVCKDASTTSEMTSASSDIQESIGNLFVRKPISTSLNGSHDTNSIKVVNEEVETKISTCVTDSGSTSVLNTEEHRDQRDTFVCPPDTGSTGTVTGAKNEGAGHHSSTPDKDELSFGHQSNDSNNKDVQKPSDSPEQKDSDYLSASITSTSSGTTSEPSSCDAVTASERTTISCVEINSGGRDTSSLGHTNLHTYIPKIENLSGTTLPVISQQIWRFSSGGRGELVAYGGGSTCIPSKGKEATPMVTTNTAPSPQETGRLRSGEWKVYGGSLDRKRSMPRTRSEESPSASMLLATSSSDITKFGHAGSAVRASNQACDVSFPKKDGRESPTNPGTRKLGSTESGEWRVYGGSTGRMSSWVGSNNLPDSGKKDVLSVNAKLPTSPTGSLGIGTFGSEGSGECRVYGGTAKLPTTPTGSLDKGRFGSEGSREWRVYGGSAGRISTWAGRNNLTSSNKETAKLPTTPTGSLDKGRFGSEGSGEWRVYGGSTGRMSSWVGSNNLPDSGKKDVPSVTTKLPTSPTGLLDKGRFGSEGSGEWRVYGGSTGRISSWTGSNNLTSANKETAKLPTSPTGSLGKGRFGSEGSGEWRVYGGSTGRLSRASSADKVSVSASPHKVANPQSSHTGRRPTVTGAVGGSRLPSGSAVRRSSSVGSGGRLSSSGSGGRLSSSPGSLGISTSVRFSSTGSGEWKPVYSSANAHRSSVGGPGWSGGGATTSSQRAGTGTGGWPSSSTGSGSKLSTSCGGDRISSRTGGRVSSSSGSGRSNSTGGRVITSSTIRSTGSGAGGSKERISVCKMAALKISAAGRERSHEKQRKKQQQSPATSPLLQRWLNTGVKSAASDKDEGLDGVPPI